MSVKIEEIVRGLVPQRTVLLFGAGASIPSGAPSTAKIIDKIANEFDISKDYSLREISGIAERKSDRKKLISVLRGMIQNLKPSGGIRNIPLYPWKSIFTTNYDHLVEEAYRLHKRDCRVYSSNFDFTVDESMPDVELFKIHGTIDKDVCDGINSRIILTDLDYSQTEQYREQLYDRLKGDLAGSQLVIIGQSLADPDISAIVNRAAELNSAILQPGRIALLMYQADEARAGLYEQRGMRVAFGSIDEFSAALTSTHHSSALARAPALKPLTPLDKVRPSTVEVADAADVKGADLSAMSSGWPATYGDIVTGLTFERTIVAEVLKYFGEEGALVAVILGAAGVGKSTAARQLMLQVHDAGLVGYEHKRDHPFSAVAWRSIASGLQKEGRSGVLFIDDGHHHLQQIGELVDGLCADNNGHLKIVIASTRNHWEPRVKSPNFFKSGREFRLVRLDGEEIDRLLVLIEQNPDIRALVERDFAGFSKDERRRRLAQRCGADMFVCLKNIFAVEAFDDIILREYADLNPNLQDVYRHVAAMENAGVHVHRQLVIRLLGVSAMHVSSTLANLQDIVTEYDVDASKHIYGWRCRHPVISAIIAKFKFFETEKTIALFEQVIDNISPTYDIEIRTIRELCNIETGLARIPNKEEQNRLLRKMISVAPGERVPRHRLIRNLIEQGFFEKAETEIKLFLNDFGPDGPVHRYRINLLVARAVRTPGILEEDRITILKQARETAIVGARRYPNNKTVLSAYAELGIEYYRKTGSFEFYDEAIEELKQAEDRLGDPDVSRIIRRFEQRIGGQSIEVEASAPSEN